MKIGTRLRSSKTAMNMLKRRNAMSAFSNRPIILPNRHQVHAEQVVRIRRRGSQIRISADTLSGPELKTATMLAISVSHFGLIN